nr:hypothetical protein [Halobaculum sp. YSMS11]
MFLAQATAHGVEDVVDELCSYLETSVGTVAPLRITQDSIATQGEHVRMVSKRYHRCNLDGRDFARGDRLEGHVERRNPNEDLHRWVVAESSERDLTFE